ncbi:cysteine dioxygenase [Chelatococcus sp. GCM10030263]|uniref:cysteine dioxygenase n=1 Tax=Chelatococcus sp. GCM10030263 TaxID=3273387 RepID=UPI0036218A44
MADIQQATETGLLERLSAASRGTASDYLASARAVLERLVAKPGLLDGVDLVRKPGTYARNLLFGDDEISVWAIVWMPGARTCIHDHHCSCCFGVLSGHIREIRFRAINERQAVMNGEKLRQPGYIACMLPSGPNIHQMINDTDQEAISLHIYGFDHRQHASSVDREYQLAAL